MGKAPTHDEVQHHLAAWLRTPNSAARPPVVAEELAIEGSWGDHGRLDVVLFRALNGYCRIILEGYEVKATRADFLSDMRSGKWRRYLPRLTRFNFAAPIGVIKESELPAEAGFIEQGTLKQGGHYWHRVRRAPNLTKIEGVDSEPPSMATLARILYKVNTQRFEDGQRVGRIYPHLG